MQLKQERAYLKQTWKREFPKRPDDPSSELQRAKRSLLGFIKGVER